MYWGGGNPQSQTNQRRRAPKKKERDKEVSLANEGDSFVVLE